MNVDFKDINLSKKYKNLYDDFFGKLSPVQQKLIKIIIIKYKKISLDEYYIYFSILYWLLFFKIISPDSKYLNDRDKVTFNAIYNNFQYEVNWDIEKFMNSIMEMDKELLKLKIVIKFCIISLDKELLPIITQNINYIKSVGYLIPILTYNDFDLVPFYQDYYFKKLYKDKYNKTKEYYKKNLNKIWYKWEEFIIISTINDINNIFDELWIIWKIKIRKKSYFSIYNKLENKNWEDIKDILWVRIILKDMVDLEKFILSFEKKHIFTIKKDFIKKPKDNWYKSIHYSYLNTYKDLEIPVELQIRTEEIDREIKEKVSHYNYTLSKDKWHKDFKEVHIWQKYLKKLLRKVWESV